VGCAYQLLRIGARPILKSRWEAKRSFKSSAAQLHLSRATTQIPFPFGFCSSYRHLTPPENKKVGKTTNVSPYLASAITSPLWLPSNKQPVVDKPMQLARNALLI
jgi:hypothetical protein